MFCSRSGLSVLPEQGNVAYSSVLHSTVSVLLRGRSSGGVLRKGTAVCERGDKGEGEGTGLYGELWRCGGDNKCCVGSADGKRWSSDKFRRKSQLLCTERISAVLIPLVGRELCFPVSPPL